MLQVIAVDISYNLLDEWVADGGENASSETWVGRGRAFGSIVLSVCSTVLLAMRVCNLVFRGGMSSIVDFVSRPIHNFIGKCRHDAEQFVLECVFSPLLVSYLVL